MDIQKSEQKEYLSDIQQLIKEVQTLTNGLKVDLAYRRQTKFTALEPKKLTLTTSPQFIEFSEPVNSVTIAISRMGTATYVYLAIEGTAGTDSIELSAEVRSLTFSDIPIKKISIMADSGTTTVIQAFGLRGG